jgi:hypothetical protein
MAEREPAALAPSELLRGVREIFTETAEYARWHSQNHPASMTSEAMFGTFTTVCETQR